MLNMYVNNNKKKSLSDKFFDKALSLTHIYVLYLYKSVHVRVLYSGEKSYSFHIF